MFVEYQPCTYITPEYILKCYCYFSCVKSLVK